MVALAAGVFVAVIAVITGAYWLLVVKQEEREQKTIIRRLKGGFGAKRIKSRLVKEAKKSGGIPGIDRMLDSASGFAAPLDRLLEQAGLEMSGSAFVVLTLLCVTVSMVLVVALTKFVALAFPAAIIAALLPYVVVRRMRNKRVRAFEEQFPEAIELVARALRAGHAFPAGLQMVAEEMKAPVGPEFQTLYDQQNFGMSLPDALRSFAGRIPLLDARFFVTAVLTQRETGGNLSEVLDNLAAVIRERFKVKRQVRVISAHGRITGWILTLLPPALALLLMVVVPGHIQKLFYTDLGRMMILLAIMLEVVGALIIRKIVQVEY